MSFAISFLLSDNFVGADEGTGEGGAMKTYILNNRGCEYLGGDIGEEVTAQELAGLADTITYEIVTLISGRVPRVCVA